MASGKVVVVAIDHSSQAEHAFKCEYHTILIIHSGGSKIFLRGAPTPKVDLLTYYFANFFPKLHLDERIWTSELGHVSLVPPLDPPMIQVAIQGLFTRTFTITASVSIELTLCE